MTAFPNSVPVRIISYLVHMTKMTQSNPQKLRSRGSLRRSKAIACGALIDLMKDPKTRALVIETGLEMPFAITPLASARPLDTRKILLAFKSALPFPLGQRVIAFIVPGELKAEPYIRLKALREYENRRTVITVMMPEEALPKW